MRSRKNDFLAGGMKTSKLMCCFVVFGFLFVAFSPVSALDDYDVEIVDVDVLPLDPYDGEVCNFSIRLRNSGATDVGSGVWIDVELLIDGSSVEMLSFDDGLQSGDQKVVYLEWLATQGSHSFEVVVFCDGPEVSSIMDSLEVRRRETDLFIDDVIVDTPKFGLGSEVQIIIGNQGKNLSKKVKLSLYAQDDLVDSTQIRYLNYSKAVTVLLSWTPNRFDDVELKIVVDDLDVLDEVNESDNSFVDVFWVEPYHVSWWDENYHFRKFFAVDTNGSGFGEVEVLLNTTVDDLGLSGTLDYDSIWLIRYDCFGEVIDDNVSYSIDLTCCHDRLFFDVSGSSRQFYCLYVDVIGNTGLRSSPNHNFSLQGDFSTETVWSLDVEGWWMELQYPHINTTLIIDDPISVEVKTVAKAEDVSVLFSKKDASYEVNLSSDDGMLWSAEFVADVEGLYDAEVVAVDNASFSCLLEVEDACMFRFLPDLTIEEVSIPAGTVDEFSEVVVSVELKNNESWVVEDATILLYVEQDLEDVERLSYDDAVDSIVVDISPLSNKEIALSWNASFGFGELAGWWNVGIKVVFAQSTVIRFDAGNISVSACERTPPSITLLSFESSVVEGDRIEVAAEIKDASGVEQAKINISFEGDIIVSESLQFVGGYRYEIVFDDIVEVGTYQMQISAIDKTPIHSKRVLTRQFSILADSSGPVFSYCGSCPEVVLIGAKVSLFCVASDRSGVVSASCEVAGPNNFSKTYNLSEESSAPGRFSVDEFFVSPGIYEYSFSALDAKNNSAHSESFELWVVVEMSDFDGDGLPNDWEQLYGFDYIGSDDYDSDSDDDGLINGEEFDMGTDPRVPEPWYDSFGRMLAENWGYLLLSVILTVSIIVVAASELRRIRG